jgi:soluble cytochrome b562
MARTKAEENLRNEILDVVREEIRLLEKRLYKSIGKKQDKAVADVEIQNIKDGTQQIATRAEEAMQMANQPHQCSQRASIVDITEDVRDIRRVLYGNRGLKYGAVVAIIVALFTGAAFIFDMRTETAVTKSQVTDMKQDVVTLQQDSRRLQDVVEKNNEEGEKKYKQILFNLQSIDSKINDQQTETRKRVRYNRNNGG